MIQDKRREWNKRFRYKSRSFAASFPMFFNAVKYILAKTGADYLCIRLNALKAGCTLEKVVPQVSWERVSESEITALPNLALVCQTQFKFLHLCIFIPIVQMLCKLALMELCLIFFIFLSVFFAEILKLAYLICSI
jgi:hypothetical protein